MRGTPPSVSVDVGDAPRIIASGSTNSAILLGNAQLTLWGTVGERQQLVMEMARELGLTVLVHDPELDVVAN